MLISNLFLFPGWFCLHPGMVCSFPWARTSANVCAEGIETDNLICHWAQGGRSPSQTGCLLKFRRPLVLQHSNPYGCCKRLTLFFINIPQSYLLTSLFAQGSWKQSLSFLFLPQTLYNLLSAVCLSSTDCLSYSWVSTGTVDVEELHVSVCVWLLSAAGGKRTKWGNGWLGLVFLQC